MLKYWAKSLFRKMGFEIKRFNLSSSANVQLATMLKSHGVNVIFDVGANVGQFGKMLREYGYRGKIVSFEPLSAVWNQLLSVSRNDPLWEVAQRCAIGNIDGEIEINVSGYSSSSSILPMCDSHVVAAPESAYIGKENVLLRRLDSIAMRFLVDDSVAFIKVDTQGYEQQVLQGAVQIAEHTVGIQLELSLVPLYEGQALFDELLLQLKESGYDLWSLTPAFFDQKNGRMLQVDATFFRR